MRFIMSILFTALILVNTHSSRTHYFLSQELNLPIWFDCEYLKSWKVIWGNFLLSKVLARILVNHIVYILTEDIYARKYYLGEKDINPIKEMGSFISRPNGGGIRIVNQNSLRDFDYDLMWSDYLSSESNMSIGHFSIYLV